MINILVGKKMYICTKSIIAIMLLYPWTPGILGLPDSRSPIS